MSFINSNGEEVSTYDNTTSLGPSTQPHLSNGGSATVGNPSTNDNITTPLLLQQYNALRRPLALSHGHRKWSSNSNNSPKYECTAHQTNTHNSNNGSFAMNGGTTDYAHYQHHAIHGNNHQCQHEQVQSLRRLSGQGSGFRQACEKFSELDAENTEMLLPDNVRGFRRNHGDSYPNEDEHLLNGHHIPKQQQQPQHLFQHQNYSEEYCSIEETHMMRNIKEESKHLLEHRWCLFMLQDGERRTQESWNDSQVEVHRFNTVEDFWCMVNHIHPPSNIGVSDYSLFKEGIKPAWEDPAVSQGGRWVAKLPTKLLTVDDIWLHVNMAMIGESLFGDFSENICGAVISIRPRSLKMSLWINCRDPQSAFHIGAEFRIILQTYLEQKDRKALELSFQSFKDSIEYRLSSTGTFTTSESNTYQSQQQQQSSQLSNCWDKPPFQGHHQHPQDQQDLHPNGETFWTDVLTSEALAATNGAVSVVGKDQEFSGTSSTISTINGCHNWNVDLPINTTKQSLTFMSRTQFSDAAVAIP